MRILIIDDEQLDLFISKKLLGKEYEVEGFTLLQDALNWAKNNTFDVVLIDYYLTSEILAHHALAQLLAVNNASFKAFVLSNYVDEKQTLQLKEAGFTDVIYKPITVDKFKEYIAVPNLI